MWREKPDKGRLRAARTEPGPYSAIVWHQSTIRRLAWLSPDPPKGIAIFQCNAIAFKGQMAVLLSRQVGLKCNKVRYKKHIRCRGNAEHE
jgi:hypothetical protein